LAEIERLDDVRMVEAAHSLGLELESAQHLGPLGPVGREHLHRRPLAEVKVLDLVDDPHPARPDATRDAVAAVDDLAEPRITGCARGGGGGGCGAALAAEPKPVRQRGPAVGTVSHGGASLQHSACLLQNPSDTDHLWLEGWGGPRESLGPAWGTVE